VSLLMTDAMQIYSRYKDPQVRALVWSLLSPSLVYENGDYSVWMKASWCVDVYQQLSPFLAQLDNDPSELQHYLECFKSWRLGIRFEAYWNFIFEQLKKQHHLQDYVAHLQIQSQKNALQATLGELDFVYQEGLEYNNNQVLTHLEIAVKFYLLKPDEFGFERLIGPNGGDWLERKVAHLFKKQLALSQHIETRQALAQYFKIPEDAQQLRTQGLIKGMIFLPVTGEGSLNDTEQKLLNPDCVSATWGTINNWYLADPSELGYWVMIDKLSWLEPQIYTSFHDTFYTAKEMAYKLKAHFHNSLRSVLIARLEYDEASQLWREQQRVMVVDKYWPTFKRTLDNMVKYAKNRPTDKQKSSTDKE
jgi:hypothetical protein